MNLPVPEQRQAERARELIEAAGGLEACAEETGLSTSQLQRYCSKHDRDSMPARVIEQLESVTHGKPGHPVMTRHLARRQGCVVVPLPHTMPENGRWTGYISRLSSEAGSLISGIAEDLADDHDVSANEASRRLSDARRLVEVAAEIEQALANRAREGDG
jgi:hypothetical protein